MPESVRIPVNAGRGERIISVNDRHFTLASRLKTGRSPYGDRPPMGAPVGKVAEGRISPVRVGIEI